MKSIKQLIAFSFLLCTLFACEEHSGTSPQPTPVISHGETGSARVGAGGIIGNVPSLPSPTIIKQTFVPTNEFWDDYRCLAWRITWPTYPAGTSPQLIPTMFSLGGGTPYSFNFLNNTQAANTFKTSFNLYHDNKIASVGDMWEELTHVFGNPNEVETVWFNKNQVSVSTVESWVKGRPKMFELKWEQNLDSSTEFENYQKDDVYLFKLLEQKRYGGIRIVSMTPRIIEVYLAEPNPNN